jgi:hypothetical protein
MQRHFKPLPVPVPTLELSLEEEAILTDEVRQNENELEQQANDVDQLGDIIVTMGDVQTVVSNTPEIKAIDQALVGATADAAVAGTDADPEDLVGSMLPDEGVSAESFVQSIKDTLVKMWESIKSVISKMWDHIKTFFQNIANFFNGTKRRIKKLQGILHDNSLSGAAVLEDDKFKGNPAYLLIPNRNGRQNGGVAFSAPHSVKEEYEAFAEVAMNTCVWLTAGGRDLMQVTGKMGEKFKNVSDMEADYSGLVKEVQDGLAELDKALRVGYKNTGGNSERSGHALMGGLHFSGLGIENSGSTLTKTLEFLNQMKYKVESEVAENPKTYVVRLTGKVDDVKAMLKTAEEWVQMGEAKKIMFETLVKQAETARSQIDNGLKGLKEQDQLTPERNRELKLMISLNGKINSIVTKTISGIVTHGTHVTNAVLDYSIESVESMMGVTKTGGIHKGPANPFPKTA